MKNNTSATSSTTAKGGKINRSEISRHIPARKLAHLKRKTDGAEKRVLRLSNELSECRAIIKRKYIERKDRQGNVIGQIQLDPAKIKAYRLKRTQIERELAIAKGDNLKAKRAYLEAIANNLQAVRKSVKMVRKENKIRRQDKILLKKTSVILNEYGKHGGAEEIKTLKDLALNGDIKGFRSTFDNILEKQDNEHYITVSGISSIKTEIVHELMDQFAKDANRELSQAVEGGQK